MSSGTEQRGKDVQGAVAGGREEDCAPVAAVGSGA